MTARDRFDLHESVGRDALGEVFRATERSSGKKAAIKVFDQLALRARDGREAYLEALRVLRDILPARTPPISGFSLRSDDGWVASRWVEGVTLHDFLEEHGPMDFAEAASVATGILDALDELHSSGQAHGGLSPRKVLLVEGRSAGSVVVTDPFQHHLYSVVDPIKTSRSSPETFFGLPEYFSPEQAQGKPPDERSDVYVVGLLLYEMLTGKSTFGAKSVSTTLKRQIYERPLAPRHARPGLEAPDDAEIILNMALNKSREDRFQSALAFRRALNNLRDADEASERSAEPMGISPVGVLVGKPVPTGELEALPVGGDDPRTDAPQAEALAEGEEEFDRASTIAFSPSELAKRMAEGYGDADIPQSAQDHGTQSAAEEPADSQETGHDDPPGDDEHGQNVGKEDDAGGSDETDREEADASELSASEPAAEDDDRSTIAFSPADVAASIAAAKASGATEADPDEERGGSTRSSSKRSRGKKKRKKRGSKAGSSSKVPTDSKGNDAGATATASSAAKQEQTNEKANESGKSGAPSVAKSLTPEERDAEGNAKPTGPINVDDDELNWFAIGDDVGALTERHDAIVDVQDTDENAAQNKRFVLGALAAIIIGIIVVMAAASLGGSEDVPESAEQPNESAPDEPEPEPAAAAADDDSAWQDIEADGADELVGDMINSEEGSLGDENVDEADPATVAAGDSSAEEPLADEAGADAEEAEASADAEEEQANEPTTDSAAEEPAEDPGDELDDQEAARAAAREREAREAEEEQAEEEARQAVRDTASTLADEGQAALRSGNWSEAQRLFGESLQHYDGSASAQAGLGQAHFEQRNYSQAARYFRAATRINSRNAGYHDSLGQAYFRLGNLDAALSAFEQAEERGHANGARNVALVRDRIANRAEE